MPERTTDNLGESRRERIMRKLDAAITAGDHQLAMPQMPVCPSSPETSRAMTAVLTRNTECINDLRCGIGALAEVELARLNGGFGGKKDTTNVNFSFGKGIIQGSGKAGVVVALVAVVVLVVVAGGLVWGGKIAIDSAATSAVAKMVMVEEAQ